MIGSITDTSSFLDLKKKLIYNHPDSPCKDDIVSVLNLLELVIEERDTLLRYCNNGGKQISFSRHEGELSIVVTHKSKNIDHQGVL